MADISKLRFAKHKSGTFEEQANAYWAEYIRYPNNPETDHIEIRTDKFGAKIAIYVYKDEQYGEWRGLPFCKHKTVQLHVENGKPMNLNPECFQELYQVAQEAYDILTGKRIIKNGRTFLNPENKNQ